MPYPNEHAVRVKSPSGYTSFARKEIADGVTAVLGIKEGKSEIQAYRFDRKKFNIKQVREWISKHDIKSMSVEEATGDMTEAIRKKAK